MNRRRRRVGCLGLLIVLGGCMRTGFRLDGRSADGDGPIDLVPSDTRDTGLQRDLDAGRDRLGERGRDADDLPRTDLPRADLPRADLPRTDLPRTDLPRTDLPRTDLPRPDLALLPGTWITVGKGSFVMGSPATEPCNTPNETQHQVTLTHDFEIGATEVRQADFAKVLCYSPSAFASCGATCPVESVSWHEAARYCNGLSSLAGLTPCYTCSGSGAAVTCNEAPPYTGTAFYGCPGYRLPTEAEWEFAYRAGTTTGLYNGELTANCNATDPKADLIAWYGTTSPHPSALKQANAWGLYDMAGNVWEWTQDLYQNNLGSLPVIDPVGAATGTGRAYRGGSYFYGIKYLRAAYRASLNPGARSNDLGFRCARSK